MGLYEQPHMTTDKGFEESKHRYVRKLNQEAEKIKNFTVSAKFDHI